MILDLAGGAGTRGPRLREEVREYLGDPLSHRPIFIDTNGRNKRAKQEGPFSVVL